MMHMSFRSKSEQTSFLWCLIFNLVRQITAWYTALAAQCFCSWKLNVQVLLETWHSGKYPYHQSICSLANYFKTFTLNEYNYYICHNFQSLFSIIITSLINNHRLCFLRINNRRFNSFALCLALYVFRMVGFQLSE